MHIQQSILQRELSNIPTQTSFLGIINLRGSHLFEKEKALHKSLTAGDEGQKKVVRYLETYGRPHWTVLQNVWLDDFGTFENDLILLTHHAVYVFEIKNYTGTFTYDEGKCYYNQFESSVNPIEQVRVCKVNLQNILNKVNRNIPVKSAVIFTGDDNDVIIHSNVGEIEVVRRTQILKFIRQIADEEKSSRSKKVDVEQIIQAFAPYEIPNPYTPPPLTVKEMQEMKSGIYCVNCLNFDVKLARIWVTCSCGFKEPREESAIRTICEYGVLTYGKDMTQKGLLQFLGPNNSKSLLQRILHTHFEVNRKGRHTTYKNMNRLYQEISEQFNIRQKQVYKPNPGQTIYLRDNKISHL